MAWRKSCLRLWLSVGFSLTDVRAEELRVVGSDLLGLDFTRAFYAFSGSEGIRLALAFEGSRAGFEQVKSGRADLGLMVLPRPAAGEAAEMRSATVGHHQVVVLVPAACPLDRITLPQLAAIFGARAAAAKAMRWGDLGATGEWSELAVVPVAPESGVGLTADFFRSEVLRGSAWKTSVRRYATKAELAAHWSGEGRTIALAATIPVGDPAVKVLAVAAGAGAGAPAVTPTPATLAAGTYSLRVPVQAVFREEQAARIGRLLEFVFSEEAARALERAEIVPLPVTARAEQLRMEHGREKSRK